MAVAARARAKIGGESSAQLYARIGQFLIDQRLEPEPANYTFAHAILANPDGPLARAVAQLTDGGIRLTVKDVESLGCEVSAAGPAANHRQRADGLVAQTQMQVEGFEDVVQGLRAEAKGFGRDLAASADAIRRSQAEVPDQHAAIDEVARITAAMVERVQATEAQLEQATREAAELREKLEEARDNARRDPLTDLPNRRAFEEAFNARAAAGETVWLAVCDVDHFKSVNDRFGHSVGDRVLKAIGTALAETCAGHLVARYGGEEFVVLFDGVDAGAARATLEAAREVIAAKHYKLRETDAPLGAVTISAGLAPSHPDDHPRSVFGRADALLYKAKNAGRNCVRVA
ncbi:MAG: diguanylate cyclase [Pseudomonadota bacterium]